MINDIATANRTGLNIVPDISFDEVIETSRQELRQKAGARRSTPQERNADLYY